MAYGAIHGGPLSSEPPIARVYPASSRTLSEARAAILTIPFDLAGGDVMDAGLEQKLAKDFNV